jgi:hypothetical protein
MSISHSVDTVWTALSYLWGGSQPAKPQPNFRYYACYKQDGASNKSELSPNLVPYYVCQQYDPENRRASTFRRPFRGAEDQAITINDGCPQMYDQAVLSLKLKAPVLLERRAEAQAEAKPDAKPDAGAAAKPDAKPPAALK